MFAGRIDAKSTYDAIISTLSHEVTHWMKEKSPAIYSKMREHIAETLAMEGTSIDKRIQAEMNRLVEQHKEYAELSNEELAELAIDELVARSCEDMLTNSKAARELLNQLTPKQQKSLIGKLQETVQKIIDWADELLNEYKSTSEEAKILREHKERLQELSKMWDAALTEAIKTNQSMQAGGVRVDNGAHTLFSSSRYDYSKPFAEQVEDYKNKLIPQKDTLLIGATPDVYKKIGLNALPMTINTTHIDYALNGTKDFDHHLGEALLEQLPEAIKNPVAIMTSATQPNSSIMAMLEIRHNGKQVVVPVLIDGFGVQNGVRIDSNAVTSAYGKNYSISKVLKDAIQQESSGQFRLYYLNKNKATVLLQGAKVPMPKMPATRNDGFIHSVRDINSPVKPKFNDVTETQQFKRWFGDWQKNPNNINRALLNQDGTPKKFYHYTSAENGEFYIFDETKAVKKGGLGFKALGKGNYFTEKQLPSNNRYGSRVIEAYVSIKNPFVYPGGEAFLDYARRELGLSKEANYDDVQQEMRKRGYDGVIGEGMGIVVAFDSSQIKSTDNIGTFDAFNPDIRYSDRRVNYVAVNDFVDEVMQKRGQTKNKYNQHRIAPIPKSIAEAVNKATSGRVNVNGKHFALEGGKLYHEIKSHSDEKTETAKGQIAYTESDINVIVDTMIDPDFIEDISSGDKLDQRNTVAFIKKHQGEMVVVAAIGGRRNPNIVAEEIIWFTEDKWNEYQLDGLTVKEIIYGNSNKRTFDTKEINEIKKNRVTVVHDESFDSPAPTSKTLLRSPLDNSISDSEKKSTGVVQNSDRNFQGEDVNNLNSTVNKDIRYSSRQIVGASGKNYGMGVYLDDPFLSNLTDTERKELVKEYVVSELAGQHFIAYDKNKSAVDMQLAKRGDHFYNKNKKRRNVLKELYGKYNNFEVKQEAIVLIDELISNSTYSGSSAPAYSHDWLDDNGNNDWDYWTVYIQEKNKTVWEATLNIANTANGEKILYDIFPIKMVEGAAKLATTTTNPTLQQNAPGSQAQNSDRTNTSVHDRLGQGEDLNLTDTPKMVYRSTIEHC